MHPTFTCPTGTHPCLIATCCPTSSFSVSTGGIISSIIWFLSRLQTTDREAGRRRSVRLQEQPLSPLVFKPIPARFKKHSRCCTSSVMAAVCRTRYYTPSVRPPPSASEADRLRSQLRDRLLSSYSTIVRQRRVPPQLRGGSTTRAFAQRFLTGATTQLPPDTICLWQDLMALFTDVHLLQRSSFEVERREKVEKVPCRGAAVDTVVLLFKWHRVGHYELVTFNDVTTLPSSHPFVQHLDQLHPQHMSGVSRDVKRTKRRRGERRQRDEHEVLE